MSFRSTLPALRPRSGSSFAPTHTIRHPHRFFASSPGPPPPTASPSALRKWAVRLGHSPPAAHLPYPHLRIYNLPMCEIELIIAHPSSGHSVPNDLCPRLGLSPAGGPPALSPLLAASAGQGLASWERDHERGRALAAGFDAGRADEAERRVVRIKWVTVSTRDGGTK